jgi:hypothetical protein
METLATPHGPQLLPRCPALFSQTPCKNRAGAPTPGEHNEEVCYDFGVDCPPRAGAHERLDPRIFHRIPRVVLDRRGRVQRPFLTGSGSHRAVGATMVERAVHLAAGFRGFSSLGSTHSPRAQAEEESMKMLMAKADPLKHTVRSPSQIGRVC